jgi:phosphosulfolactate phosphohydrolase-like enzyme
VSAYRGFQGDILSALKSCSSGKELFAEGYEQDVVAAAAVNVDDCAPLFKDGAHIKPQPP